MSKFQIIWVLLQHKWFILLAGRRTGAPLWRLLIHDLSKLSPIEFPYYAGYLHKPRRPEKCVQAWIHHQNSNPHHWEYWVPRSRHYLVPKGFPINEPIPMPDWAIKEMVADWMADRRVLGREWPSKFNWPWLEEEYSKIRVHKKTRKKINMLLRRLNLL